MSATIGISTCLVISFKALDDASSGQETLTMSAPSSWISIICLIVDLTFVVNVFVIDCTDIGLSPPTFTFPTFITLVFLLSISLYGLMLIFTYLI